MVPILLGLALFGLPLLAAVLLPDVKSADEQRRVVPPAPTRIARDKPDDKASREPDEPDGHLGPGETGAESDANAKTAEEYLPPEEDDMLATSGPVLEVVGTSGGSSGGTYLVRGHVQNIGGEASGRFKLKVRVYDDNDRGMNLKKIECNRSELGPGERVLFRAYYKGKHKIQRFKVSILEGEEGEEKDPSSSAPGPD
jgi:hypothetical protein